MQKDLKRLGKIYRKTDGYCHICHKKLSLKNHGIINSRGAWHIEHSIPKAKGGTDHLNNLFPACVSCNIKKGTSSTKKARIKNNVTRAPYSKKKKLTIKKRNTRTGVITGGAIGLIGGPLGVIAGAVIGGIIGNEKSIKSNHMEKDRLLFTISRFDHYFESVNNKSNIILGFGSLISGILISIYPSLLKEVNFNIITNLNFVLLILIGISSILFLMITSVPHLKSNGKSIHFFKSISDMGKSKFMLKSEETSADDEIKDLRKQVYYLADGLTKKYKKLKIAIILLVIQLILTLPFLILTFSNLKK